MRIRRLQSKHQENDKDSLDQAELDFQSLCRSFGDSDDDTPRRLPSSAPIIAGQLYLQSGPTSLDADDGLRRLPSSLTIAGKLDSLSNPASLDADDGDEQENAGDWPIHSASRGKDATEAEVRERPRGMPLQGLMIDGKDDARWAAEYARRDAAYPREERARQACERYYQRSEY